MKWNKRVFFGAFFITLLALGAVGLLVVADNNTKAISGMMDAETVFSYQRTAPFQAEMTVFNDHYEIDLTMLETPLEIYKGAGRAAEYLMEPVLGTVECGWCLTVECAQWLLEGPLDGVMESLGLKSVAMDSGK